MVVHMTPLYVWHKSIRVANARAKRAERGIKNGPVWSSRRPHWAQKSKKLTAEGQAQWEAFRLRHGIYEPINRGNGFTETKSRRSGKSQRKVTLPKVTISEPA
jgi:hypothetical protein